MALQFQLQYFCGFFFLSTCIQKRNRVGKTRYSVSFYLNSKHSPKLLILKMNHFLTLSIRNFECNVYFGSSPILIPSFGPASVTAPVLSFFTLVYLCFHSHQLQVGGGGGGVKAQQTVTSQCTVAWYE